MLLKQQFFNKTKVCPVNTKDIPSHWETITHITKYTIYNHNMTDEKDETNEEHVEFVTDDTPYSQHEGRVCIAKQRTSYSKDTCEWANSQPILSQVLHDDPKVIQKVLEAGLMALPKLFHSLPAFQGIRGKILNQEVQITITTPALGLHYLIILNDVFFHNFFFSFVFHLLLFLLFISFLLFSPCFIHFLILFPIGKV